MPTPMYMTIQCETMGKITDHAGDKQSLARQSTGAHEDEILIEAFSHEVYVPTDPQTGQPTGSRVHKPIVITKMVDKSSPLLYNACASREKILKATIKWYRVSAATNDMEHYFTTEVEDALIVSIKAYMPHRLDLTKEKYVHHEDVSITYKKITWDHKVSTTSGTDQWE